MKKIIIILLILVLGIASVYAQEAQGSQDNQGGEEYIVPKKNTFWGFSGNFGISRLSLPDNQNSFKSSGPGLDWGLHLNATFYISDSPIGINMSFGFDKLTNKWTQVNDIERTNYATLIPFHIGLAVRSGGLFVNAGISLAVQSSLSAKIGELTIVAADRKSTFYGFYVNLGYRVTFGRMYIPLGLEFVYYLTDVAETTLGAKWLQFNFKFGIEF